MIPNIDQMRSVLSSSGILSDTQPGEHCVVVLPSRRLRAEQFLVLLRRNGVRCRTLGRAEGQLKRENGETSILCGLVVAALLPSELKKFSLYTKLFDVDVVVFDPVAVTLGHEHA